MPEDLLLYPEAAFWVALSVTCGCLLGLWVLFARAVRPLTRREPPPGICHADAEVRP